MNINIRKVKTEDIPTLQAIFLASRRKTFTWLYIEKFQLTDFDRQTEGEAIFVAENHVKQTIGFISVWEADNFIHHLYVRPGLEGNGIGKALLNALPNWEGIQYTLKCVRHHHKAIAFYKVCGFTQAGVGTSEDGEYILFEHKGSQVAS